MFSMMMENLSIYCRKMGQGGCQVLRNFIINYLKMEKMDMAFISLLSFDLLGGAQLIFALAPISVEGLNFQ